MTIPHPGLRDPRRFLRTLFDTAIEAANPLPAMKPYLPDAPKGKTIVIGAGKGAAQLARSFEMLWPGPLEGTVVTRYGYGVACDRIEVLEASHPVPDAAGLAASARMFERVAGLTEDDLVVALVCGGGSALLPSPPEGFKLDDEIELSRLLLSSGAPISVMNMLRKQFSKIKGGRLALAATPARVVSLVVSDIPGDNPAFVSSGPTIPDASTVEDALKAAARYRIGLPSRIHEHIVRSSDAPKHDDLRFQNNEVNTIVSANMSLEAAAAKAFECGVDAVILSDAIEGEASEAGLFHAALALQVAEKNRPFQRPVVLLSGGETTVTLRGQGRGGRNTEFLLSFAGAIAGAATIHGLAADTDGIDGSESNAGAFADGTSIGRIAACGLDPFALLAENDAFSAFEAAGDLLVTGPTGTNVNDFRAILIS